MTRPHGTIGATIQARMTSTRLPGKVLMPAVGKPMLELMVERLKRVASLQTIVIATTTNATDDPVAALARKLGVGCYRGSEHDVVGRVCDAARAFDIDLIVQTTGDCPLIDPNVVEQVVALYQAAGTDYASNILERTYPIGMDTQVFRTDILADAAARARAPEEREHVGLFVYRHPEIYSLANLAAPPEMYNPSLRLTLDTPQDYELIRTVFERLYPANPRFSLASVLALIAGNPTLRQLNDNVRHNWMAR